MRLGRWLLYFQTPEGREDVRGDHRPGQPIELQAHRVATLYNIPLSVAWEDMGGKPLTPREKRWLTMAASEAAGIEQAVDELEKAAKGKREPDIGHGQSLLLQELTRVMHGGDPDPR